MSKQRTCYRCGKEIDEGLFCNRCRDFLIRHKLYKKTVRVIVSKRSSN